MMSETWTPEDFHIESALADIRQRFPRSRSRMTVVIEQTPRGIILKKSSVTVAVYNNVVESASRLTECMAAILEWRERDPEWG